MPEKIIRPERRRLDRRPGRLAALSEAVSEQKWEEKRTHCWDIEPSCSEERRKRCSAHFVRRNCWDLWAAEYFPPRSQALLPRRPGLLRVLDCLLQVRRIRICVRPPARQGFCEADGGRARQGREVL